MHSRGKSTPVDRRIEVTKTPGCSRQCRRTGRTRCRSVTAMFAVPCFPPRRRCSTAASEEEKRGRCFSYVVSCCSLFPCCSSDPFPTNLVPSTRQPLLTTNSPTQNHGFLQAPRQTSRCEYRCLGRATTRKGNDKKRLVLARRQERGQPTTTTC